MRAKEKLKTKILKVVSQGYVNYVPSEKQEGGQLAMSVIRLRELGGQKIADEFVCAMFGNLALCRFYENEIVAATLRFHAHETGGNVFQNVTAMDIVKLKS